MTNPGSTAVAVCLALTLTSSPQFCVNYQLQQLLLTTYECPKSPFPMTSQLSRKVSHFRGEPSSIWSQQQHGFSWFEDTDTSFSCKVGKYSLTQNTLDFQRPSSSTVILLLPSSLQHNQVNVLRCYRRSSSICQSRIKAQQTHEA